MAEKHLGFSVEKLEALAGEHTAREIEGQPGLWEKTWHKISNEQEGLQHFLEAAFAAEGLNIVLTGAGTSAFIGEVAEPLLNCCWPHPVRAISTTTLVTHFEQYIDTDRPLLLISFARSGNSPESIATVQLAEETCKRPVYHLVITCNAEGRLAQQTRDLQSFCLLMPPEAEDQSLAMTGSFSSMLLAVMLVGQLDQIKTLEEQVQHLASMARHCMEKHRTDISECAGLDFNRAVFLGSGPRLGIARESHLKLQELTDGKVICKYDSFLGFRHGPKAVIDDRTLLVYLFSEDPHVYQYEKDLVQSISDQGFGLATVGVGIQPMRDLVIDLKIDLSEAIDLQLDGEADLLPIVSVLPAQMLGFYCSLKHGLQPDAPSVSGAISRVVEGVTIYPHQHHHE